MNRFLLIFALLFGFSQAFAEEWLHPYKIVTDLPQTGLTTLKTSFSREAVVPWMFIAGSTGLLYHHDEDILRDFQHSGRQAGIGNSDKTRTVLQAGPYPLLRLPSDTGSALYFLGDGWTHFGIAAGFALNGYGYGNNRAWNTGVEITHGMIASTFFSQAVKRATGREAPSDKTEERGRWRPFPSLKAYQSQTPTYDAFPSGHIMTATLTFTIINENYPEYWMYTVPIGALWVTALGYQMVNNGVHWASDYPLGIAMGYHIGKIVSRMSDPKTKTEKDSPPSVSYQVFPSLSPEFPGFFVQASF